MSKAIFKFNSGNAAILCSGCHVIIKTGKDYTDDEILASKGEKYMDAQFCLKCNIKRIFNNNAKHIIGGYLCENILLQYMTLQNIDDAIILAYIESDKNNSYKKLI